MREGRVEGRKGAAAEREEGVNLSAFRAPGIATAEDHV